MQHGMPSARSVDHTGFLVPDLDEATDFFTRVLGCELLYRAGPFFDADGDWMTRHFGAPPRASVETAMLRCGPSTNVELLAWRDPDASAPPPSCAADGVPRAHLAIFVDDVREAADYLAREPGVHVLGAPAVVTGEPNEGTEFVYVRLPWGMHLELVRWPPLMPYHQTTAARLAGPAAMWRNGPP